MNKNRLSFVHTSYTMSYTMSHLQCERNFVPTLDNAFICIRTRDTSRVAGFSRLGALAIEFVRIPPTSADIVAIGRKSVGKGRGEFEDVAAERGERNIVEYNLVKARADHCSRARRV